MLKSKCMLAAAIGMAIAALSLNAQACSTVVVGKDVSATGQIIVGHNEDNDLRHRYEPILGARR